MLHLSYVPAWKHSLPSDFIEKYEDALLFSVMNVDYVPLTALRLLESFAFASILLVYDGTGGERHIRHYCFCVCVCVWKLGLPENALLPRNQQRNKKQKPPPQLRESRE